MIEVQNLYKEFDGVQVLKNISTMFEDGKTNLIIGQSGSGNEEPCRTLRTYQRPYTLRRS